MARWVRVLGAAVLIFAVLPISAGKVAADSSSPGPDTTDAAATNLPLQDQAAQVAAPDVPPSDLTKTSGDTGQMAITDVPGLDTQPEDAAVVPRTVSGDWGLEVAQSVSAAEVQFGDPLSYTLTVRALGTLAQTAVVVRDGIPRGTTYASGSAACDPSGQCMESSDNNEVTWELGHMAPGATRTVTFRVTVDTPRATTETGIPAVTIRNTGLAYSTQVRPTPSNELVTDVVAVAGVKRGPNGSGGPTGSDAASDGSPNPNDATETEGATPETVVQGTNSGPSVLAATGTGIPLGGMVALAGVLLLVGAALLRLGSARERAAPGIG